MHSAEKYVNTGETLYSILKKNRVGSVNAKLSVIFKCTLYKTCETMFYTYNHALTFLQVIIDRHPVRFFVHKRPHVDFFLEVVSKLTCM